MPSIGIIGIGSPFGADNIAEQVINELNHHQFGNQVHINYYDRPGLHLLDIIKPFNTVHLIDAMVSNKPVGTIHRFDNLSHFEETNQQLSSHGVGVAEVLRLAEALQCLPQTLIIHGIEIEWNNTNQFAPVHDCNTYKELAVQIKQEVNIQILNNSMK